MAGPFIWGPGAKAKNLATGGILFADGTTQTTAAAGSSGVASYANFAAFPASGTAGTVYIDEASADVYLWTGAVYELQSGISGIAWGAITGTLSNQTDLQTALDLKAPKASPTFTGTITTPLTASRVAVMNGSSQLAASTATATELETLQGATGNVRGIAQSKTLTNTTYDAEGTGNSLSNVKDSNIKAAAGIAVNKLAALTASRAVVTDGSGFNSAATTTATEIGYVNGVTSAIQTQLNAKLASTTTPTSFWAQMPTFPASLNYFVNELDIFPSTSLLGVAVSGTSAAVQLADASTAAAGINSTEKSIGVLQLQTGTTNTGRAYTGYGIGSTIGATIRFGSQAQIFGMRMSVENVSTGVETYTQYLGFLDIHTAVPTNGVFFRQTDGTNSGKWEYVSVIASSLVAADTGVSIASTVNQVFEIVVNAAGTNVTFYIDGALVGTVTSGIPTAAGMAAGYNVIKSNGTTNRRMFVDATYYAIERLATR